MGVTRTSGSFANMIPFGVSADGRTIATRATNDELRTLRVTDLHQEVIRDGDKTKPESSAITTSIALSPDGVRLFTAERGAPGWIRRWVIGSNRRDPDAAGPTTTAPCGTPPTTSTGDYPTNLTVSLDGRQLAFSQGRCVVVWDALTLKPLAAIESPGHVGGLLFRADGTLLFSSRSLPMVDPRAAVRIWNWRTNRILATALPMAEVGSQNSDWRLASSSDGSRIAMVSSAEGTPSTVSVWDGDLQRELGRLPSGDFATVALSADGRRIVSVGREDASVRIWDGNRFLPLLTLVDTDSHLGGVTFTAQGQIVAARTSGGLTIWESQRAPCPLCPGSK